MGEDYCKRSVNCIFGIMYNTFVIVILVMQRNSQKKNRCQIVTCG